MQQILEIEIDKTADCELLATLNEQVHNLHCQLYPQIFKPYNYHAILAFYTNMFQQENTTAFVALHKNKHIGYIICKLIIAEENAFKYASKSLYVDQLWVIEQFRKQGVAQQLMQRAEETAKELHVNKIEIDHWFLNKTAGNFFKKNGYHYGKMGMIKHL